MLINTGNISRKVLSKVLRSFVKNFERLHCDYLEMPVGEMLGDHRHINDLDEVKHLMDVSLKQKAYIENLEAELNECKMLNNQLMSDLDVDEGLAEICVNEFIADTIKAVKDAGVKKITVEF